MRTTVITDASWCPDTRASGYGVWVSANHGKFKRSGSFKKKPENSYEAELWAAYNGIDLAVRNGATRILIQTDCLQVVNYINNKTNQCVKELRKLCNNQKIKIFAKHVKGHTNREQSRYYVNRWCDAEAYHFMQKQRDKFSKGQNSNGYIKRSNRSKRFKSTKRS